MTTSNPFFDHPVLKSRYERPSRHSELDETGQPTQRIADERRPAQLITPMPRPKRRTKAPRETMVSGEGKGLSTEPQQRAYTPSAVARSLAASGWK